MSGAVTTLILTLTMLLASLAPSLLLHPAVQIALSLAAYCALLFVLLNGELLRGHPQSERNPSGNSGQALTLTNR